VFGFIGCWLFARETPNPPSHQISGYYVVGCFIAGNKKEIRGSITAG